MKTYQKRIGFLISSQTLVPHGGIGQFARGFCELMTKNRIKVDLITDKIPHGNNKEFAESIGAELIYPDDPLKYTSHTETFLYGDSYCYERMANFRSAIIKAMRTRLYDVLICNTYETVQVASTLGLEDHVQIIAYTHLESQIFKDTVNPFIDCTNAMMRLQLLMPGITVGTQSAFNKVSLEQAGIAGPKHLPIPISEPGLLNQITTKREGVLFIGRWEEAKHPELYVSLIAQTKLPARVMTNANGAKKFESAFKSEGITDYKIAVSIVGQEKVEFITGCRTAFNPSTVESYGMAFHEQIAQLPTLALNGCRWTNNFDAKYFTTCTKKNMAQLMVELYNEYPTAQSWYDTGALTHVIQQEESVFHKWNACWNEFSRSVSNSSSAKICQQTTTTLAGFFDELGRKTVCIDDLKSVYGNLHRFRVIQTDTDSYLTKDPNFEPSEIAEATRLFDGL